MIGSRSKKTEVRNKIEGPYVAGLLCRSDLSLAVKKN